MTKFVIFLLATLAVAGYHFICSFPGPQFVGPTGRRKRWAYLLA